MKVIYFSRDYTTHDHRFLSALAETGHEVHYLRLEQRGHVLEDRPLPTQIRIIRWAGGCTLARLQDSPRLLLDLKRVIREVQPDLIHAGTIHTGAFLTALSGFRPLVSMSWGSDLLVDADRSFWYRCATRFTLRHSDVLVGDCNPVRQKAIAFGMHDERIVTFPWGVDLERYSPESDRRSAFSNQQFPFTLLSTRAWEAIYGVEVIARAFVEAARQLEAWRGPKLRLIMLGNGSQAALLRKIFSDGGVEEQVYFPGQVNQASLPRCFRSADLYVAASHSDGTSISLLEALACGRPVLVSDIPGNREWIEPGVQGWLFPDGDAESLAQAILQAVEQREQLPEMGRRARQLAEQRADWKQNFQHLLHAYQLANNK